MSNASARIRRSVYSSTVTPAVNGVVMMRLMALPMASSTRLSMYMPASPSRTAPPTANGAASTPAMIATIRPVSTMMPNTRQKSPRTSAQDRRIASPTGCRSSTMTTGANSIATQIQTASGMASNASGTTTRVAASPPLAVATNSPAATSTPMIAP